MSVHPGNREIENLRRLVAMARAEDLGSRGDVTSSILPDGLTARGGFVARQELVFCGGGLLAEIAAAYDAGIETRVLVEDGLAVAVGEKLAEWRGPARSILTAERVALNFLQRLSGIATLTAAYIKAAEGAGADIRDTRKTTPGWRDLEKYAVRAGGGRNHRMGLYDAVLVKDNHLTMLASQWGGDPIARLGGELDRLRAALGEQGFVEVEVDSLDQLASALKLPVDVILLDNMTPEQVAAAVRMRNDARPAGGGALAVELEASGGITLANVRQVARTGVERIAIGALTQSAGAVDIALDIPACLRQSGRETD